MAVPTIYFDTGGTALGSGSTDTANPTRSSTIDSVTVSVSGTTVTFSGATNLAAVPNDGSATIFINDATNSNQKIFKITGVNDGADTLTVDIAPTGVIATSTWGIGGQIIYDSAIWEGAQAPGWTFIFNNSPASKTTDFITQRVAGTAAAGLITVKGKTGVRPKLTVTNTTQCIQGNTSMHYWSFENLELEQQGASGNVIDAIVGAGSKIINVKVSDGGAHAFSTSVSGPIIVLCEFSGVQTDGYSSSASNRGLFGCYIHDCGGDGVSNNSTAPVMIMSNTIIDTCTVNGILLSGSVAAAATTGVFLVGNTIYGCGNSGLEITDIDMNDVTLVNNIFMNNGNAANEYNVEWVAGTAEVAGWHDYNLFFQDTSTLATGAANLFGLTATSTESVADPLFTDAPNGNFALGASSPAKATGFPGLFLGGSQGYMDMGAVQRQESTTGPVGHQSM